MVVSVNPENSKKRKKDDISSVENNLNRDVCTEETSSRKNLKMDHPNNGDLSSEMSQGPESDCSQHNEHSTQDTVSVDEDYECSNQSSLPSTLKPQQKTVADSKLQDHDVLKLDEKHVFTRLMVIFTQEKLPDKIIFNGSGFNLTAAYDEFWKTLYNSSCYSVGHKVKVLKVGNLKEVEFKTMAKILKRGWEDERYWPKELCRPFLESCLFEEPDMNSINPDLFLKFIDPEDELLLQNKKTVDENVIEVFKKYCSVDTISIGDGIDISFSKAANEIMIVKMKPAIDIWYKELNGLMPMSTFDHVMDPVPESYLAGEWEDLGGCSPPHELWQTFFLGWPQDKVKFYFDSLTNAKFSSNSCNLCGEPWFNAKHFLCVCEPLLNTMRVDRHDAVLTKLQNHIDSAIERKSRYFSKGNDWKVLISYNNEHYDWPEEMSALSDFKLYPHLVVYSLSPEKKALIIVHSITWDHWLGEKHYEKERKTEKYSVVKEKLEDIGFEVEFRVFDLGSRGVFVTDLYNLFDEICGMKHSEISKAHEEISQEILNIPYQSKYYKELITTNSNQTSVHQLSFLEELMARNDN